MIHVIKNSKRCNTCNSILSYEEEDIKESYSSFDLKVKTIECPVCNKTVVIGYDSSMLNVSVEETNNGKV